MKNLLYLSSIFFLTALSVDRMIAVTKPTTSTWLRTRRGIRAISISIWIAACIFMLPEAIFSTRNWLTTFKLIAKNPFFNDYKNWWSICFIKIKSFWTLTKRVINYHLKYQNKVNKKLTITKFVEWLFRCKKITLCMKKISGI